MEAMSDTIAYDEFSYFHENASEFGLPYDTPPAVRRAAVALNDGRAISALVWGDGDPELVLLHGGAQNAHTWDTLAMALRPTALVAIDLPGHGHSSWRPDGRYDPRAMADDVAVAVANLAPAARGLVGMSLGGLTAIALAGRHPELMKRLLIVDVTPGTNRVKAKAIIDFVNGPQSFASFDEIFARTVQHNPTRTASSLRRCILHNARQLPDGSWVWRYDRSTARPEGEEHADYWEDVSRVRVPMLLARGGVSPVVDEDDVAELRRRQPTAEVVVVDGAGHSIQGDRPLELAALIRRFALP